MKENGMSLLEVLVLMGILSLVSGMVIPRLPNSDSMTIDSEAAFFVSKLRYLQEVSCTTQRWYEKFPAVEAEGAPSFSVQSNECHILQGGKPLQRHWYPNGMTAFSDRTDIFFASNGTAPPVTITLRLGKERRYVIIDIVGRVRIAK